MKVVKRTLLILCLIFPVCLLANDGLKRKPVLNLPYMEYRQSAFRLNISEAVGFRHISWELDADYQFRQYFSIGLGSGFHFNTYPIFSTPDKHRLNMWSSPVFLKGTVYVLGNSGHACYVYGKYGRSFGIDTKDVDPDKNFKAVTAEGGVAYERRFNNGTVYFELGQYYTSARGVLKSSYSSIINYNLQMYTVVGRIGLRIRLS